MKKIMLIILATAILFCFTACTEKPSIGDSSSVAVLPQVSPNPLILPTPKPVPKPLDVQVQTNENGETVLTIKDEDRRNELIQSFLNYCASVCVVDENNIIIRHSQDNSDTIYNLDLTTQKAEAALSGNNYDFKTTNNGNHVFLTSDENGNSLTILKNDNTITTQKAPNNEYILQVYENENGYGFITSSDQKLYFIQGEEKQLIAENVFGYDFKISDYYLFSASEDVDTKLHYRIFDYKTNSLLVPEITGYETAISIGKDIVLNGFAIGENIYGIAISNREIVDVTKVFGILNETQGYQANSYVPAQLLFSNQNELYFYNFPQIIKFDKATSQITTICENIYSICETNEKIYAVSINEETGDIIIKNIV